MSANGQQAAGYARRPPYRVRVPKSHRRVMLALLSGAGNLSGFALCQVAQAGSGQVYPCLDRLENAGWVIGEWDREETPNGGRRRYYSLTPAGREQVWRLLRLEDPPPPGTRLAELPPLPPPPPRQRWWRRRPAPG